MSIRAVLILMAIAGLLLLGYSLHLHEYFMRAGEGEIRIACRQLCQLQVEDAAGAKDSALGGLASALAGTACDAMDGHTKVLLDCRDRLRASGMTVAAYRCIGRAHTLGEARACDAALR